MSFYVTDSASEVVVYLTATKKVSVSKEVEKRMRAVCQGIDLADGRSRRFIFVSGEGNRCGGFICHGTAQNLWDSLIKAREIVEEFEGPVEVLEKIDLDA